MRGAHCPSHPEAPAVATCARCGTFLCGECTEVLRETAYCAPCVAWLRRHGPPSRVIQGVLGLNVLGLVLLPCTFLPVPAFIAGVCGLGLGLRELRRIARGEGPERGRAQARVALALACVNLVVAAVWVVAALSLSR